MAKLKGKRMDPQHFSLDQIKQAISDGVEYEEAVKTGHMNDQMAVELFIVQYSKTE